MAETRAAAELAFDAFIESYTPKADFRHPALRALNGRSGSAAP
jgi:hypothetical protein